MTSSPLSPIGAVVRGAVAGAVGILAMDLVWYRRYRNSRGADGSSSDAGFASWEFSSSTLTWEEAAAPAQVGRRVVEGFLQRELPESWAGPTNNVVHWLYGLMWGAGYGIVAGSQPTPRLRSGLPFATLVWSSGYAVLPLAKLYKPIWDYDAVTLAKDLSAHVAFGMGTAGAFRVLVAARR